MGERTRCRALEPAPVTRLAALVAVAVAVAFGGGCAGGGGGEATLWVTRDQGRHVLLVERVPAGLTAMQALQRKADVETRYGGRYVHAIEGIEGSLARRHDWFYFVNGIEGDRSAAEYRLRPGDIEWWDYRDWGRYGQRVAVVVGAFPEPFVHGYGGEVRPTVVLGPRTPAVRRIARLVHARRIVTPPQRDLPQELNTLTILRSGTTRFTATMNGGSVHAVFRGDPRRLARDPSLYRYRYRLP
jgi:Domain of unknown function (DUF4430)